jgi:hypothetical protein
LFSSPLTGEVKVRVNFPSLVPSFLLSLDRRGQGEGENLYPLPLIPPSRGGKMRNSTYRREISSLLSLSTYLLSLDRRGKLSQWSPFVFVP